MAVTKHKSVQDGAQAQAAKQQAEAPCPWERQPDEPFVAYSHFVRYRNADAAHRSIRKLGISMERASRLSSKHKWVARAALYDEWLVTLSDETAKHRVMGHQAQLVRFGSASLTKATKTVSALDETRLSVADACLLAKTGDALASKALGLGDARATAQAALTQQTVVQFANGSEPQWANKRETEQNQVLVHVEKQVIAECLRPPAEAVAQAPGKLSDGQLPETPRKRLLERMVEAPKGPGQ